MMRASFVLRCDGRQGSVDPLTLEEVQERRPTIHNSGTSKHADSKSHADFGRSSHVR